MLPVSENRWAQNSQFKMGMHGWVLCAVLTLSQGASGTPNNTVVVGLSLVLCGMKHLHTQTRGIQSFESVESRAPLFVCLRMCHVI